MTLKLSSLQGNIRRYALFIFLCFAGINSFAQSVISSTGDHFENTEYQLSSTLGETSIKTLEAGDVVLTQGFHQTKLTVTSINDISDRDIKINVYPNPASDYLNITIDEQNFDQSYYILYNISGEKLKQNPIQNSETQISFNEFSPSVYFIKVFINNQEINTYKIIKQ